MKRIKVQLTKSQFIDGVLHTVDPKADPVTLNLLEEHALALVEAGSATLVPAPAPSAAEPASN